MKFPPVRNGAKLERKTDASLQKLKQQEHANWMPDFQPTVLRENTSRSPEPVNRLVSQRSAGKAPGQPQQMRYLRRTKSNDINPGQAYSPSQQPKQGNSPWGMEARSGPWRERKAAARAPALVPNHPCVRGSSNCSRKGLEGFFRQSERLQANTASRTKGDSIMRKAQTVQEQTSTSSSCSSQSASQVSQSGSRLCSIPKDVIQKFGLRSNNKPDQFDREGELRTMGGCFKAAAVSYGGRTNWNWKKENQDMFLMEYSDKNDLVLLGVFDGHGVNGGVASADVKNQLVEKLHKPDGVLWNRLKQDPEKAMKESFAEIDNCLRQRKVDWSRSGTTGIVVVVDSCWILTAWAGDSRAVLGQRKGTLGASGSDLRGIELSKDHKPDNPKERKRIISCNGRIDQMVVDSLGTRAGPFRVYLKYEWQPGLATSRAFGDTMAKMVGVTSEPECHHRSSNPQDKLIIVASDGVWEVVSSQEAAEIVSSHPNPRKAANALVAVSLQRWLEGNNSRVCDDITVVVFFFDQKSHRTGPKKRTEALPILHT